MSFSTLYISTEARPGGAFSNFIRSAHYKKKLDNSVVKFCMQYHCYLRKFLISLSDSKHTKRRCQLSRSRMRLRFSQPSDLIRQFKRKSQSKGFRRPNSFKTNLKLHASSKAAIGLDFGCYPITKTNLEKAIRVF